MITFGMGVSTQALFARVGDPFKDTCGPSMNILIKLMSMVAVVMAGVTVALSLF